MAATRVKLGEGRLVAGEKPSAPGDLVFEVFTTLTHSDGITIFYGRDNSNNLGAGIDCDKIAMFVAGFGFSAAADSKTNTDVPECVITTDTTAVNKEPNDVLTFTGTASEARTYFVLLIGRA